MDALQQTSAEVVQKPAGWMRRILVGLLRVGFALAAGVLAWRYEAWAAIGVLVAAWVLWDPLVSRRVRIRLACVAVPILVVAGWCLLVPGVVGYRLAYGTTYDAVGALPAHGGVRVAFVATADGGEASRLLPGLVHARFGGPYHVGVHLYDERFAVRAARFVGGMASTPDGSARIPLDLRRATYVFDAERDGVKEDGWLRFQREWRDTGGDPHQLERAYVMASPVGNPVDLDALGSVIVLTFTLEVDVEGRRSSHPVTFEVHRREATASGTTIASP